LHKNFASGKILAHFIVQVFFIVELLQNPVILFLLQIGANRFNGVQITMSINKD